MLHPGPPRPKLPYPVPTAPHPGPQGFYKVLKAVRERADVQDVLVEIDDLDGADSADSTEWPFSEVVYILTQACQEDVEAWVAVLFPDAIQEGYFGDKPSQAPELLPGYQVYAVWWD